MVEKIRFISFPLCLPHEKQHCFSQKKKQEKKKAHRKCPAIKPKGNGISPGQVMALKFKSGTNSPAIIMPNAFGRFKEFLIKRDTSFAILFDLLFGENISAI
ncbi:hypothetical protein [Dyadobacter diqingensis]|uniref:hypothetical protein n=1 Tax=Dyadobacter diqingensis TaxID=2938121 RepID=UPI0020C486B8|nr:hypothetical protein [Dyadobacter diqingensis]